MHPIWKVLIVFLMLNAAVDFLTTYRLWNAQHEFNQEVIKWMRR